MARRSRRTTRTRKNRPETRADVRRKARLRQEVAGVLLLGLAALSYVVAGGDGTGGALGGILHRLALTLFGQARMLVPVLLGLAGIGILIGWGPAGSHRLWGMGLATGVVLVWAHVSQPSPLVPSIRSGLQGLGGGLLGGVLSGVLVALVGETGRTVVLVVAAAVSLLLLTHVSVQAALAAFFPWARRTLAGLWRTVVDFVYPEQTGDEPGGRDGSEAPLGTAAAAEPSGAVFRSQEGPEPMEAAYGGAGEAPALANGSMAASQGAQVSTAPAGDEGGWVPIPMRRTVLMPEGEEGAPSPAAGTGSGRGDAHGEPRTRSMSAAGSPYRLPPLSLLPKGRGSASVRSRADGQAKARLLEDTLDSFGVAARVIGIEQGPAVTRFELELARGVKVSRVQNLANDIALSLAAADVRIEAPIPGRAAVGIEVPNREVAAVALRDVLESPAFRNSPSPLTMAVGKDIAGQAIITTLDQLPHVLIAGATGSGKSVCISSLLASLLYKARPDQVRLLLIDPKVVELSSYNGIPHLLVPVITDARRAAASLQWLVREMERRYESFAARGVRDIGGYNRLMEDLPGTEEDQDETRGELGDESSGPLPYIVVVIDELADLMMVAPSEVEDAIQRLAQMARAAGIHLVVATQRPSVDVITGVIKANIPSRIAFSVSSQTDSRVILDSVGAEKLVGKGDMLFYPMGASKPIRVQGCYVSEKDIDILMDFIRDQAEPEYDDRVLEAAEQDGGPSAEVEDDLFPEAVRLVVEAGQASVSLLQRRLRVGYTRAGRLVDMMEERGLVGPHLGSRPRDVRITPEQYHQMFGADGTDGP